MDTAAAAFATKARAGAPLLGTFIKLAGFEPLDLVARAGFDFAVIDLEHSQLDVSEARRAVRHCATIGLPAVVRVPAIDEGLINRLLEVGAAGVQLSSLRRSLEAARLCRAMRYPPDGQRSVSSAQPAADYGRLPLRDYLAATAASPPLVIGQIETHETDDPLEEILAHLDLAFLGMTDLSVDLGAPGEVDDARVVARIAEVAGAATRAGVVLGGFAGNRATACKLQAAGARYLILGSDLQILQQSLTAAVRDLRVELASS